MRFRGPVYRDGDAFVVAIDDDEAAIVRRLLDELRQLLSDPEPGDEAHVLLQRLFPVVHPDDDEAEAEYQRLMREELVESKLAAFGRVDELLAGDGRVDDAGLLAFMQSINSVRLALGTMLGVSDDPDEEVAAENEETPEYALYTYLSWLLDWSVRAMQS